MILKMSLKVPVKEKEEQYAEGLEVNVPYTKDEPEERVNPFTGEPYTAIYKRRAVYTEEVIPLGCGQQCIIS